VSKNGVYTVKEGYNLMLNTYYNMRELVWEVI
jgi:hypothetical protein